VDADFPSGNIVVEKIDGDTITVHQDLRDTEGWWFYWCFRVSGAAGRTLTFKFTDRDPIGVRGPAFSLDEGRSWQWLGKQPDNESFTFAFPQNADSVRFSFGMPYTEANLREFLAPFTSNPALKEETLCKSRKGRTVEQFRVGKVDGEPRFRVLLSCRAHSCEMMTSYVAEGIIETVLKDDADGKWFRENVEFLFIPFVDKDGVEDGDQGKHRRPRDHNRDYDANSIYPETRALQKLVPQWSKGKLRFALDMHCPTIRERTNEIIHIVGSDDPKMWQEQERFGKILERIQEGPLHYRTTDNVPFGTKWNTGANYELGVSGAKWASGLPGIKVAMTVEIPYANASGNEVNATSARAFGRDIARAMRSYLETAAGE
jgi:hypothetical protein